MFIEIVIGDELVGTPLEGTESLFVKYGVEYGVDPLLAVAIAYHESHYCKAYAVWHNRQYHNCAGIMNGGQANGLVAYQSWEEFIRDYNRVLSGYLKSGKDTISEIGSRYAPVSSHKLNHSWNGSVTKKYNELWRKLRE